MSTPDWQFPWIPLSQLREMYRMSKTYISEGFSERDLWHLFVQLETDRLMAEYWHDQIEKARNYIGIEGYSCPLCVYDNGVFVAHCEMHKQIESLREQNNQLRNLIVKYFPTISGKLPSEILIEIFYE